MEYDDLILKISDYNKQANDLCKNLSDIKHTLNEHQKAKKVKEILAIWANADLLLKDLPES